VLLTSAERWGGSPPTLSGAGRAGEASREMARAARRAAMLSAPVRSAPGEDDAATEEYGQVRVAQALPQHRSRRNWDKSWNSRA
jgi:hypothetical protein